MSPSEPPERPRVSPEVPAIPPVSAQRLLRGVTEALVGTLDPEQAAARLCELAVPALADWAVVTLIENDPRAGLRRSLRHPVSRHRDHRLGAVAAEFARLRIEALADETLPLRAVHSGRALVAGDATPTLQETLRPGRARELMATLAPEHAMLVPLPGRHGPVGLLSLFNDAGRGPFDAAAMAVADDVAARAGLVLDNARLYDAQRSLAEALQRSMLTPPPAIEGLEVAVRYTPAAGAAEVGGDWHDVFVHDGSATFVIGDVVGHDTAAAAAMGQIRTLLRGIAVATGADPATLLGAVDTAMADLQLPAMATAVVAQLTPHASDSPGSWRLRWANAGHPPPLVAHPDGRITMLDGPPELLLGVRPGSRRSQATAELDPGTVLLLYTDGLIEAPGRHLDDGLDLLRGTLHELIATAGAQGEALDLDDLCDELLARVVLTRPEDDVALLAVRRVP